MSEKLNIHQRMLAIIKDVGAVEKTGDLAVAKNRSKKTFTIDHVVDALREPCRKHGVMLWSSLESSSFQVIEDRDYNGNPRNLYVNTAKVRVVFVNVDSPEDTCSMVAEGDGYDYSDKAPGKAFAYALKTILLANFQMRGQPHSDADDIQPGVKAKNIEQPERAEKKEKQAKDEPLASDAQLNRLRLMLDEPKAGKITIGGKPIREYIRESLAKKDLTWRDARSQIDWVDEKFAVYDKEKK